MTNYFLPIPNVQSSAQGSAEFLSLSPPDAPAHWKAWLVVSVEWSTSILLHGYQSYREANEGIWS
jgi:hypothetical protein